jgi:fructose-1,6-bisphosphatase/inositol monophosphatase family enzyme
MREYMEIAKEIALEAGSVMTEHFGMGVQHTFKEDAHSVSNQYPVTEADQQIQQLVTSRLEAAYPAHSLYGEEGKKIKESEFVWVFDPIDGTAAFMRGIPTNVFSLALVHTGVPVLGVVYDPYLSRMYHAIRGEGAYLNDQPISTSSNTELAKSYIELDGHKGFKNMDLFERAREAGVRTLSYSSTVYANMLVATGQLEGVVFPLPNAWDCAAAKVIVEEAGGITSDVYGNEQRYDAETKGFVSAANPEFHQKLLGLIAASV